MRSGFVWFTGFLPLLISLFIFQTALHAQDNRDGDRIGNFGFRSAGASLGWFNPAMSYWNDTYFQDGIWESKFKGALSYSGYLEFNVIRDFRLRASATYWTERVNSGIIKVGAVDGTEQLTTSLTFLTIDALYRFNFLSFAGVSPYAGAGGSYVMVQNKFVRLPQGYDEESYTNQGQDMTASVIAGLEKIFVEHLGIGLEFRYTVGNYTQDMKDTKGTVTSHPVSLNGPQVALNLSYILR
jgi:opacity protein-like surface antigen